MGAQIVELASDSEFQDAFPDCETGAIPPFGNLYHMSVYADVSLPEYDGIPFSAGTHCELVRMNWLDVARLVNPMVEDLTYRPRAVVAV